jgi:hypothetical protein
MRVHPAARQVLARDEDQVGFAEYPRFGYILSGVKPAIDLGLEEIEEAQEIKHFNEIAAGYVPQKHGPFLSVA